MSEYIDSPYISIIIPIYNTAKYLDQCINSVLSQTLKNIEIICIDDGSSDNSLEKIYHYKNIDNRIHIFKQKNKHVGVARNNGLSHASGEYVYFLDSNDFIMPTCLEKIYIKAKGTNADIVLFNGTSYVEDTKTYVKHCFLNIENITKNIFNVYDYPDDIFNCTNPSCTTKLYKRTFLKEACILFSNYITSEDIYFASITQVMAKYITFIDEDLFIHRINSSISVKNKIDTNDVIYALIDIYKKLNNLNIYNIVEKSYISRSINTILYIIHIIDIKQKNNFIEKLYKLLFSRINIINLDKKYYIDIKSYYKLKECLCQYDFCKKHIDFKIEQKLIHENNVNFPLVSVVIPMFNVGNYISKCIESIINQTLKNIEIICINDGSTDNSLDIVEKYANIDSRITIYSENNCGQGVARNLGIEVAKGKYIYFIDSDDWIDKDALFELFEKCESEKLDLVFFGAETFADNILFNEIAERNKQNYIKKGKYDRVYSGIDIFKLMFNNGDYTPSPCLIFAATKFYKKNHIRFIDTILHEDEAFTFEACLLAKRVFYINKLYYKRRYRHNSTMTKKKSFENVYGYFKCYLSMIDFIISNNIKFYKCIVNHINNIINNAIYIYNNIDIYEKHNYFVLNRNEYVKFYFYIVKYCDILNLNKNEIENLKIQLLNINKSFSFKIGRFITYIPRIVRDCIRKMLN